MYTRKVGNVLGLHYCFEMKIILVKNVGLTKFSFVPLQI